MVADDQVADMYRIKRPDGSLSDMCNLSRARDAARMLTEVSRPTKRIK